ncbi:transmembrane protein 145 [Parasteatoda tepidariorum]|uniref:transmembrane protein 145 n=1 Tax=Parasteatoda tepidariorum TaxID=114398 RepID=UPI00077F846F|nr:integral membrane protein GPR180 [Parasteatoda tepidariorum]
MLIKLCSSLYFLSCIYCINTLHLTGQFNTNEFFKFLTKFGFQKTIYHDHLNTLGFIYGNITAPTYAIDERHKATFVVVDRQFFLEYYKDRSLYKSDPDGVCNAMFKKIDTVAFDKNCKENGTDDLLRSVPCPRNELCEDEDAPQRVVNGHQFTYAVLDKKQARFWYISLVACYRYGSDNNCTWKESSKENIVMDYDIWLANGNPYATHRNPFEFQLSFDQQGTVEMYLGLLALYLILVPLQLYAAVHQRHHVTRLYTASLVLQLSYVFCIVVHMVKFALDGEGVAVLEVVGDVMHLLAESLFMLLLLLLAKGWAITRTELTWKPFLFCVWMLYTCVSVLLYVWNMTEVDVIDDIDEYQTFPGWIFLILRLAIMVWFLYELRSTMLDENDRAKLRFYVHFGAGILVWFVYLPVVALIALQISALWRAKLLLGITSSADFLAYAIMSHLLSPTRSEQYFQLASESDPGEELEEFNEAPHNVPRPQKV